MIIENLSKEVRHAIDTELQDFGKWCLVISNDKSILQVVLYNYNKNLDISIIQDIGDCIKDVIDNFELYDYVTFGSYVEWQTGNIIFEFGRSLWNNYEGTECLYSQSNFINHFKS